MESRDDRPPGRLDIAGMLTSSIGLVGVVFGLIEGSRYGWFTPTGQFALGSWTWPLDSVSPVFFALVLGAAGLIAFVRVESRRRAAGATVLFDMALFRLESFRYGNAAATIVALGELGMIFILPLFVQAVLGYSAFRTGVLLLPLAIGAFIGGPTAAQFANRYGPRRVVSVGMGLEAVAIFTIGLLLAPDLGPWTLVPSLFVYGVGVGLASAQLTSVVLAEVPPRESGQGSGMQSTFRQIGAALGIALLGTVLAVSLRSLTDANLADRGVPADVRAGIVASVDQSGGQVLGSLRQDPANAAAVTAIEEAFAGAARRSAFTGVVFVVIGFGLSLLLPETRDLDSRSEPPGPRGEPA